MVPSSHEVNTKLGRERLQHPPVSPACTYSHEYLDPVDIPNCIVIVYVDYIDIQ